MLQDTRKDVLIYFGFGGYLNSESFHSGVETWGIYSNQWFEAQG